MPSFFRVPALVLTACFCAALLPAPAVAKPKPQSIESVQTLNGYAAPGTPAELNRVRILKQGDPKAENVLVLIPGTSGGAAYFRPLASSLIKAMPDYQVWSIDRRENLLEDHSRFDQELAGEIDVQAMFDYYLGWLTDPSITPRFDPVATDEATYAREWGMNVAVRDLRVVVKKAAKKDRTVVLGGHSLGGSIATAYASWDFGGKPGVKDLSGLVFIDGGSLGGAPTAEEAQASLDSLATSSPFADPFGFGLPWAAGVFNEVGASAALDEPLAPSIAQAFPLLPSILKPPVPVTNRAQYGYAVDADTAPSILQVRVGSLAPTGALRDWENGELGTVERTADAFRGIEGMDGLSWYHPSRLSVDAGAVNNGIDNPAQDVLGDDAIFGRKVNVPIYAFETSLGTGRVIEAARQLAAGAGVRGKDLELISKPAKYSHHDPLIATASKNAFLKALIPFLEDRVK